MAFLDNSGVTALVTRLKTYFALKTEITSKQDKLTAGYGITITDNTIAVSIPNANGVSF